MLSLIPHSKQITLLTFFKKRNHIYFFSQKSVQNKLAGITDTIKLLRRGIKIVTIIEPE